MSRVIGELADAEMDVVSNCPPWTVRRLASHAIKNQLFWAGLVTGRDLMPQDEAMAAVPYDGDLAPIAAEVSAQVVELWHTDGVMTAAHVTPFGACPAPWSSTSPSSTRPPMHGTSRRAWAAPSSSRPSGSPG